MQAKEWVSTEKNAASIKEFTWISGEGTQSHLGALIVRTSNTRLRYQPISVHWYDLLSTYARSRDNFTPLFRAAVCDTEAVSQATVEALVEYSTRIPEQVLTVSLRLLSAFETTETEMEGSPLAAAAVCATLFKQFDYDVTTAVDRTEQYTDINERVFTEATRTLLSDIGVRWVRRIIEAERGTQAVHQPPTELSRRSDKPVYATECDTCGDTLLLSRRRYRQLYYATDRAQVTHSSCGAVAMYDRPAWTATTISR